jgi:DNA-binding transcriptional regulator YhcF (GntR family)
MKIALDHRSPVPLYHQLAEGIRYAIATGEIKPDTVLPPLRRAAPLWGVNLHTVRRAYGQLARNGVVSTQVPDGTRVLPALKEKGASSSAARNQFVRAIVSEARLRHGLSAPQLIDLIRGVETTSAASVSVLECSVSQSEDLAAQIRDKWRVRASAWPLDKQEPPHGTMIATYFHYNDVRLRWPERLPDTRFLTIIPEAALRGQLERHRRRGRRLNVVLCERDDAMARNIAADLIRILPVSDFQITTTVVKSAKHAFQTARAQTPILFSPRMWGELSANARRDPRAHEVRYVFDAAELEALGVEQGWDS